MGSLQYAEALASVSQETGPNATRQVTACPCLGMLSLEDCFRLKIRLKIYSLGRCHSCYVNFVLVLIAVFAWIGFTLSSLKFKPPEL